MRQVVLTDKNGNAQGIADLMDVHTGSGKLHRAFSVYVFRNNRRKILVQKRSPKKMLWGGIWANTCCSHPFPGEEIIQAGERRLKEECGIQCMLKPLGTFVYRAEDPQGKGIEHEHVTILVGEISDDRELQPDPQEVADIQWMSVQDLLKDMKRNPDAYAPWFHIGLDKILSHPTLRLRSVQAIEPSSK